MGASAVLSPRAVSVQPGTEAVSTVTVRNTGTVVDEFRLSVLGDSAVWADVEPYVLSLLPGAEGTAEIRFRPPRSSDIAARTVPFGLRAASREDPDGSTVEEGTVEVTPFADTFAEIIPRTARGRVAATFDLAFDNRGNTKVNADVSAVDPNNALTFEFLPAGLVAEPNTASFSKLKAKPRKRFLRGPARTHAFQVTVAPNGTPPFTTDATLLQEGLIPKWAPKALLALAALALLWLALFRPTVKKEAKNAVKAPLAAQGAKIADLEKAVTGTTTPQAVVEDTTTTTTAPAAAAGLGDPFDRRLAVDAKGNPKTTYKVEDGKVLSLTDILLQNPAGDTGNLEVRRGDAIILRVNLANFRDLDYHFVSAVTFKAGEELTFAIQCANPNPGPNCTPAAYFSGFLRSS
jgi:hypothetical protein